MRTETYIRENFKDYVIFRTSKQVAMRVDPKNTLSELALKLRAGEGIRCATDGWIAPAFVEDIVQITLQGLNLNGIYHISPPRHYSRLELGHKIADSLSLSRDLVKPCLMKDFNFPEVRPPRTTLNGGKLHQALGYNLTDIKTGLVKLVACL